MKKIFLIAVLLTISLLSISQVKDKDNRIKQKKVLAEAIKKEATMSYKVMVEPAEKKGKSLTMTFRFIDFTEVNPGTVVHPATMGKFEVSGNVAYNIKELKKDAIVLITQAYRNDEWAAISIKRSKINE